MGRREQDSKQGRWRWWGQHTARRRRDSGPGWDPWEQRPGTTGCERRGTARGLVWLGLQGCHWRSPELRNDRDLGPGDGETCQCEGRTQAQEKRSPLKIRKKPELVLLSSLGKGGNGGGRNGTQLDSLCASVATARCNFLYYCCSVANATLSAGAENCTVDAVDCCTAAKWRGLHLGLLQRRGRL